MKAKTLEEWVSYISTVHATEMELGLARVRQVADKLGLLTPDCPVITIGGTNGKGSCVAGLEAVYRAQGYNVGAFTSPYLIRLNEEIRINGVEASDRDFCSAFEKINKARGDISLTIFEFNTLAALEIFRNAPLDLILLEVGLGGRLDAVNIIDADLTIVSSIALDHIHLLGDTRDLIAREKAGIFRPDRPAVCGDFEPPSTLLNYAREIKAKLFCQGQDFYFTQHENSWDWQSSKVTYQKLPLPSLALQNMSTVLMAVELLQTRLPVEREALNDAFKKVTLPGRLQIFPGAVTRIFDVSHNPAAAGLLAKKLSALPCEGKTHAVFSMLADKDIVGTVQAVNELVDDWYIAALPVARAAPLSILQESFFKAKLDKQINPYPDIARAYQAAIDRATPGDRVVVFGSFYTVAEVIMTVL
ncbi:MAG: bifunctional tetrahydrofolate synthase/dihydrofolate synthase [Pseudomonadota bacterium]